MANPPQPDYVNPSRSEPPEQIHPVMYHHGDRPLKEVGCTVEFVATTTGSARFQEVTVRADLAVN